MNRIFNLIWSKTKEKWIVVSEKVKGNGKVPSSPLRSLAALTALFMGGVPAYAIDPGSLPTEGQITAGSGTITTSGTQMTVNQSSQQLIANWGTFNIGENAAVRFNQPNSSSAALNRIFDQNPSQIMGSLSSNGQVFLLNPAGIIFGKTARVDVGGLVASSLNMLDSDFLAGKYTFTGNGSSGALLNQGVINTANGGVVALMAPTVTNEGSITANSGSVLLASGNKVSLDFTGDGLISYTVDQGAVDALVENKGLIKADGGLVVMTSRAADALHMATTTNSGVIEAHTIQNKAGRILLLSDMANGQTNVGGTLDASAPNSGDGGFIETSAGRVRISDGTIVTTLAPKGKTGTWLIDPTNYTIDSVLNGGNETGAHVTQTLLTTDRLIVADENITVNENIEWTFHTLTLTTTTGDININAVMKAGATADPGTFAILDLEPGSGKVNMGFNPKGRVDFFEANGTTPRSGTGFLTINGNGYTVITDLGAYNSSTVKDLQGINNGLDGYYALGSNIDASPTAAWNSDGASTPTYAGFTPIGNSSGKFTGTFDGLGHTISALTINSSGNNGVGLFGYSNGTIRNVALVNASVTGNSYVGALVGYNHGRISNSYASGSVTGSGYDFGGLVGNNQGAISNSHAVDIVTGIGEDSRIAGGLVGNNYGTISNSYATGSVVANGNYAGGLVGIHHAGSISNSYARGNVTGGDFVGGLVGTNWGGSTITNSFATGNVEGTNNVGGLVGDNYSTITGSNATGSVIGTNNVGGLVGYNEYGTISNSFATGSVDGTSNVGGLVGENYGTITGSNATGSVEGTNNVGGLVGDNYDTISNSYATGSVTGNGDFVGGLVGDNNGTITHSHATGSVEGTGNAGGLVGDNYGTITNSHAAGNVDGTSNVGGLVGVNSNGTVGNSYATGNVAGSSVTGSKYGVGGLVGVNNYGTITKSYATGNVTGGSVTGSKYGIGGLVGVNFVGTITDSHATGSVDGLSNVGGLVGENFDGTIANSYATGNVSGYAVGGLVGYNLGVNNDTIRNSYATGNVTEARYGGGLVGLNAGTIRDSYAKGNVSGYTVGGLVGYNVGSNHDTISNSYATGSVAGERHAGGLVGENDGSIFDNCYATGSVSGARNAGGLVGYNLGSIGNSYAAGSVTGERNVGGLVGDNYGTIEKSYARGRVAGGSHVGALVGHEYGDATLSNSFYEKNANPLLTGVGDGTPDVAGEVWGMSTANMKLLSNFMEATAANGNVNPGWDFTPGTGVWKIDAATNGGYPYLAWQNSEKFYERPVLSEPLPGVPSYPAFPIAPTGPLIPEGQFLEAKIVNLPLPSAPGLILVTVPQSLGAEGSVFSFVLPDELKNSVGGVVESVTLPDGAPLPSWLHYKPETMTFTATDMPQGMTEFKVLVTLGGKSWIVDIAMAR